MTTDPSELWCMVEERQAALQEASELLQLAAAMLAIEANDHRFNQQPRKAEAVEGAIAKVQATIAKLEKLV